MSGYQIPEEDSYVAWLRWSGSESHRHLVICDSDAGGAFKVYRRTSVKDQIRMIDQWNATNIERNTFIENLESENRQLREVLEEALPLIPHSDYAGNRCQVCGWPIREDGSGCTATLCTFIPSEHSADYHSIKKQRIYLKARAALAEKEKD